MGGLLAETASTAQFGQLFLHIPAFNPQVNWTRRASRVQYEPMPLEWPTVDYNLSEPGGSNWRGPDSILVSDESPCFPMFSSAFRAFFHGDYSTMATAWSMPTNFTLRILQNDARIRKATITPTRLDVMVDGAAAEGCKVEVNGATYRASKAVGKTGRVRLPLPHGLPDDAWLYLSRGTRWLDYRAIGDRIGFKGDLAKTGVTIEVPRDPEFDLEALITAGECSTVEFKERIPTDRRSKRNLFKTVAAFANGSGGTILIGVADNGAPMGLDADTVETAEVSLNNLTRAIVHPNPDFAIRRAQFRGQSLLLMHVAPGTEGPYGIQVEQNEPVEFYVRRNASSFPATVSEIRHLARAELQEALATLTARPGWGIPR
ncbi:MAG TPA: ATP-binding protein [Candidatus Dormibacteraeota bacterium]|nr:ATP-binding protein [Candidatus Dormibacteraeota bacterium]